MRIGMDYQEIKQVVGAVLQAGGFSPDEPLNSIKVISGSYEGEVPAIDIGALSSVLAWFGEWDRAEAVARSIRDNDAEMGSALAIVAQRLAAADLLDRAEAVARSITNSEELEGVMLEKATALIAIASKFAKDAKPDRAAPLLDEAEVTIKHMKQPDHLLASLLGDLAETLTRVGQSERAIRLWDDAVEVARESIRACRAWGGPDVDSWKAVAIIAGDLFAIGENERAERAIALIDNDEWRERVVTKIRSRLNE